MIDLMNRTGGIDPGNVKAVKDFIRRVKDESESTLAALDGLEDEIRELQNREDLLKKGELSLEDLEEKYQKHFNTWRERQESLRGADN
jgi:ABC-type uncharacterized transport system ATPase subunit